MRQATGLQHFVGRRPSHVIKEMFFTAALIDAQQAKEWLLVNHVVPLGSQRSPGYLVR